MTPDPTIVVDKAEALVKQNRLKDALQLYSNWLKDALRLPQHINSQRDESVAVAYNNRGHLKYLMVDFQGAVQDYNAGLEYNSILPCIYYNRGTIMYRMGHFGKAVEDMTIASRLAPECPDFQIALQRCTDQLIRVRGQLNLPGEEDEGLLNDETNEDEDGAEEGSEEQEQPDTNSPLPIPTTSMATTIASKKPRGRVQGQTPTSGSSPTTFKSEEGEVTSSTVTSAKLSSDSPQHTAKYTASFPPETTKGQGQEKRLSNKSNN